MTFRSLRERKLLSQEKLAEMSGLSLRTIQRAEAGYRVSYASLRALAVTFEMDVDLLERELYLQSVGTRIFDTYKLWPASEISWSQWRPARRLRTTIGFYAFVLVVLALFFSIVFQLR